MTLEPGAGKDDPMSAADRAAEPPGGIVGESRWPMAGVVLAAMVLTYLLPEDLRLGPRWVLPLIEGLLLVAVVVGDPGQITRRSALLRGLSIGLVAVLVFDALLTTGLLIDDLLKGGPETNSASALLSAGATVFVSNNIAFSLLFWELDNGGAAARAHHLPRHPDLAFPRARVQPNRHHATGALGQDRHGGPVDDLTCHPRPRGRQSRERVHLTGRGRNARSGC